MSDDAKRPLSEKPATCPEEFFGTAKDLVLRWMEESDKAESEGQKWFWLADAIAHALFAVQESAIDWASASRPTGDVGQRSEG